MSDRNFNAAQQAFETITRQYDSLRSQDVGHREAIDFIVLEHGLQHQRRKVVALINDHLAEVAGQSGEQFIAIVSERDTTPARPQQTPQGFAGTAADYKPAHGGYPGVVDPGTIECPDTLPEGWS